LIYLSPDTEGRSVEDDVFLFVALHQHQSGKHSRTGGLRRSYGIQDHGMGRGFMLSLRTSRVIRNNDRNHASTGRAFPETPGGASGTASIDCDVLLPDSTRKLLSFSGMR